MVDSILTNQAPIAQKPAENRSITSAAVSNASSIPEIELTEDIVDVTPRTMDANADQQFSPTGREALGSQSVDIIRSGSELAPPLENFRPIELTTERVLESRVADLEIRDNNSIDEIDTIQSVNNKAIEAFQGGDTQLQQAVDISA